MVNVFINKAKLNDYDKNILYWAILFHDVGKFHEMNTIYKEDYSRNKFVDKVHPFKSAIIFIQTALKKNLIFFNDEKEKKEFIDFFEKQFVIALYESFEQEKSKYKDLIYNINFNHFDDVV
jgi:CRISPR/Cas system-associated endonuclease Cas3-HD